MIGSRRTAFSCVIRAFILLLPVAALVIPAALFLPQQSIYVDEATQLSGLELGSVKLVRWLAGSRLLPPGIPGDRMPPLSYWLEMGWSFLFGLNESRLRWFGIFFSCLAVMVVAETSRRAFGSKTGWLAGLLFALSPRIIVTSVNIRAYPLFLFFSACAIYSLVRHLEDPLMRGKKWLAALILSLVLSMYTHYYGLVMAGCILGALYILARRAGAKKGPVKISAVCVALSALGLIPFVLASLRISRANFIPGHLRNILRLGSSLFSHTALLVNPLCISLACFCVAVLVALSLRSMQRASPALVAILMILVMGFTAAAGTGFIFHGFNPANPKYNIWMLPGFYILLSSSVSTKRPRFRSVSITAGLLLSLAFACGAWQLISKGTAFSQLCFKEIEAMIQRLEPGEVTVIHDKGSDAIGHISAPIVYRFRNRVQQLKCVQENGMVVRRERFNEMSSPPENMTSKYLLEIRSRHQSSFEIAAQLRRGETPLSEGPVSKRLDSSEVWKKIQSRLLLSFVKSRLDVFQRSGDPTSTSGR